MSHGLVVNDPRLLSRSSLTYVSTVYIKNGVKNSSFWQKAIIYGRIAFLEGATLFRWSVSVVELK